MPRTKEQLELIKNESKSKIIEAALELFIKKGFMATSIKEIATMADVSKGLMYHYFKTKDDLICELIADAINGSQEYMNNLLNLKMSPKEKIQLISKTLLDGIQNDDQKSQWFVFINKSMMAENIPEKALEHFRNAYIPFEIMEKIVIEGQQLGQFKNDDPKAMTQLYWSAIHGLCANKLIMGGEFVCPSPNLLSEIIMKSI